MTMYLITAPSGAGKTTIVNELSKAGWWNECISHTTRPMRTGEIQNKTYYYINRGEFIESFDAGEFAESVTYDGNYYAIANSEISRVEKLGKDIVIIVEYDGYTQIKRLYPDAVGVFLYMSKEDCMANMLLRGDSIDKATKRIKKYEGEMHNSYQYDYVIKNVRGKLTETVMIIKYICRQNDNN